MLLLSVFVALGAMPADRGPQPIIVAPESSSVGAGETINITITCDKTWHEDVAINVSSSNGNLSVPTSVLLPAGHSSVVVIGTAPSNASGSVSVSASANGGSAQAAIFVNPLR
jgi:hypothetical protein